MPSYVRSWAEVDIFSFASDCLKRLQDAGYPVFVVTNQSIVGRGHMTIEAIMDLHDEIMKAVDKTGAVLESFVCPHAPEENCDCRKPLPGSLIRAAAKYQIDLSSSYMVGDAVSDVMAGQAAGAHPILVLTGRGKPQHQKMEYYPDLVSAVTVCPSLVEAVEFILQ